MPAGSPSMISEAIRPTSPSLRRNAIADKAVQINAELHRVFRSKALAEKRREHSRENIAHAAARHARVAGGIDKNFPVRRGDYGARPFENQVTAVFDGKRARDADAIGVDIARCSLPMSRAISPG